MKADHTKGWEQPEGGEEGTPHGKRKLNKMNAPLQRMLAVTLPPLGFACTYSNIILPPRSLATWHSEPTLESVPPGMEKSRGVLQPQAPISQRRKNKLMGGGVSPWDHTYKKTMIEGGGIKSDKINRKGKAAP